MKLLYKEIIKLLHDSLKQDDKYAWDKVTTFFSFSICVIMGFVDMFTPYKISEFVYTSFVAMAAGGGTASIIKHKIDSLKGKSNELL